MDKLVEVRRKTPLPFTMVDNVVITDPRLSPYDKYVFTMLCKYQNGDRECWPSFRTLAEHCGISRSKAIGCLNNLEKAGYISRQSRFTGHGDHTSNIYYIMSAYVHVLDTAPPCSSCYDTGYKRINGEPTAIFCTCAIGCKRKAEYAAKR